MTSISGSLRFHRSRATRQLCAPKSTATRGFRFTIGFIVVCSPSSNLSCDREEWSLSKKCLRQASIHWDQVTSRTTRLRAGKKRSEEHTSELQSRLHLVCRLLLEKKKKKIQAYQS